MPIFYITLCIAVIFSGDLNALSFEMDRGIGFSRGRDIEDWVEAKPMSESPDRMNAYTERMGAFGDSTLASSTGNSIVIQTQPGSHVVLNSSQINLGNQSAEVTLSESAMADRLKNVEIPSETQGEQTKQWNHSAVE